MALRLGKKPKQNEERTKAFPELVYIGLRYNGYDVSPETITPGRVARDHVGEGPARIALYRFVVLVDVQELPPLITPVV